MTEKGDEKYIQTLIFNPSSCLVSVKVFPLLYRERDNTCVLDTVR